MNPENKELKLSDQVIGQIRELLQLCLATKTNFVDHCRALRLELEEEEPGKIVLSKTYLEGWNAMVQELYDQAEKKANEDSSENTPLDKEVVN